MPHQETSLLAYESIQDELGNKQTQVLAVLDLNPDGLTNQEVSDYLGWPINTVTPRMNELVRKGFVVESGRRICKTGRKAIVWSVVK
jgi:predicted transcriptional regulator